VYVCNNLEPMSDENSALHITLGFDRAVFINSFDLPTFFICDLGAFDSQIVTKTQIYSASTSFIV
jgi:hypothetical protein